MAKITGTFLSVSQCERAGETRGSGASYSCAMDPEVVQDHPGDCPKCRMALEPVTPVAGPAPEMADFTRRLIVSVSCAVPLMGLSMGTVPWANWLGLALASPVVLWAAI